MNIQPLKEKFAELYGSSNQMVYASPGRINIIGEHTDYNGGFVLPGAIDKGMVAVISFNNSNKVRAFAFDLSENSEFGLEEADAPIEG